MYPSDVPATARASACGPLAHPLTMHGAWPAYQDGEEGRPQARPRSPGLCASRMAEGTTYPRGQSTLVIMDAPARGHTHEDRTGGPVKGQGHATNVPQHHPPVATPRGLSAGLRTIQLMSEQGDSVLVEVAWDPVDDEPIQLLMELRSAARRVGFTGHPLRLLEYAGDDVLLDLNEGSINYAYTRGLLENGCTVVLGNGPARNTCYSGGYSRGKGDRRLEEPAAGAGPTPTAARAGSESEDEDHLTWHGPSVAQAWNGLEFHGAEAADLARWRAWVPELVAVEATPPSGGCSASSGHGGTPVPDLVLPETQLVQRSAEPLEASCPPWYTGAWPVPSLLGAPLSGPTDTVISTPGGTATAPGEDDENTSRQRGELYFLARLLRAWKRTPRDACLEEHGRWGTCECPSGCTRWARGRRDSARLCDYCAERAPGRWNSNCNCWCQGCWQVGRGQPPTPARGTGYPGEYNRREDDRRSEGTPSHPQWGQPSAGCTAHATDCGTRSAPTKRITDSPPYGTLRRPCVDCGVLTIHCCDASPQPCLAAGRLLGETRALGQFTPLCPRCDEAWGMCRFCRADHLMPVNVDDPNPLSGRVDILGQATSLGLDVTYTKILNLLTHQALDIPDL